MEAIESIIIQTHNFKTIFNVCDDAIENHKMIVVTSPAGYGKTTGLISYKMKYGDNVIYLRALKSQNARLFYSSIFNEIGDDNYNAALPIYFSIRKAASVFYDESKNMLLIIDEAGKISPTGLEYLHEFRDLTKSNTGIVLSGVDYFKSNLESWNLKERIGIPEFYSRINAWQELAPPTFDEIVAIIRAHGINDPKFERTFKNVKDFRELSNQIQSFFINRKKTR